MLVSNSSTITMMHGPRNIQTILVYNKIFLGRQSCQYSKVLQHFGERPCPYLQEATDTGPCCPVWVAPWRRGRTQSLKRWKIFIPQHGRLPKKILLNSIAAKASRHTTFSLSLPWQNNYRIYSRNTCTFLTKILYLNLGCVIYARKRFYVNKSGYTSNFLNIVLKVWITWWRELRE